MSVKNSLTNERLNDRFDNAFSLVNYAISMARQLVLKGEQFQANPANEVLELIVDYRDGDFMENEDEEMDEEEEEETIETR